MHGARRNSIDRMRSHIVNEAGDGAEICHGAESGAGHSDTAIDQAIRRPALDIDSDDTPIDGAVIGAGSKEADADLAFDQRRRVGFAAIYQCQ